MKKEPKLIYIAGFEVFIDGSPVGMLIEKKPVKKKQKKKKRTLK